MSSVSSSSAINPIVGDLYVISNQKLGSEAIDLTGIPFTEGTVYYCKKCDDVSKSILNHNGIQYEAWASTPYVNESINEAAGLIDEEAESQTQQLIENGFVVFESKVIPYSHGSEEDKKVFMLACAITGAMMSYVLYNSFHS